jgi:hypothetical protein
MIPIIIILILIYIVIGIYKVISDSRLRLIDQPDYIRHPKFLITLLIIIMWFPLLITELKEYGVKHTLEYRRRLKKREKRAKLERMERKMARDPVRLLLSEKYHKAAEEAIEEINREKQDKAKPNK